MIEILLILLFAERVGHVAKSKGRNPWPYRFLAVGVCLLGWAVGTVAAGIGLAVQMQMTGAAPDDPVQRVGAIVVVVLFMVGAGSILWAIVRGLSAKEGAPGEAYLTISFPCPECDEYVSFKRHHAGLMESCPKCKKKVIVPEETVPPPAESVQPTAQPENKPPADTV